MIKIEGFYVYRFLDENGTIIYVGRTRDLEKRLKNHEHLSEKVKAIEYINCNTGTDMAWKEIYYINKFFNENSENVSDVFPGGVTDLNLCDKWKKLKYFNPNPDVSIDSFDIDYEFLKNNVDKIHIIQHAKLNDYGTSKQDNSLSAVWFRRPANKNDVQRLKRDITNYFRNVIGCKSDKCCWTCFTECRREIANKGFTKGFVPLYDTTPTNKQYLAFACNIYFPIKGKSNDKEYALKVLLQFIWRSAIRDGQEIWVYIPSIRMRGLLYDWIAENSPAAADSEIAENLT